MASLTSAQHNSLATRLTYSVQHCGYCRVCSTACNWTWR